MTWPARSELIGAELVWLLRVTYAGRDFYWSSKPCAPLDEDGAPLPHDGGLNSVDLSETMSGGSGDPDLMSFPFDVFFAPNFDVAAHHVLGHELSGSPAEVAIWIEGTAYTSRHKVLVGQVAEPEYGGIDESVSFSVEAVPWDDTVLIPDAAARVTETTWPSALASSMGEYYPIVFGCPGRFTGGICPGSPATPVETTGANIDTLLIKDSRTTVAQVTIRDPDGYDEVFAVTHQVDGLGRTCAVVDITAAAVVDRGLVTGQWWAIWDQDGDMAGAGDLLVELLELSSLDVDLGAWSALSGYLNRFKLGGYIDDPCTPWDYIIENIIPLLPMEVHAAPSGLAPLLWRYDATAADAVEHIEAGPGIVRLSRVASGRARETMNRVRIEYAMDPEERAAQRRLTVSGEPDPDNAEEIGNYFATVAMARHGLREAPPIETDIVWEDATAFQVVSWMIQAYAAPPRWVLYQLGQEFGWLRLGDIVTLSDTELSLDAQVLQVSGRAQPDENSIELEFKMVGFQPRDRRT